MTIQTFLTGFTGGLCAILILAAISAAFLYYWIHHAPFLPEDELLNDTLPQRCCGNGQSAIQEEK